MYLCYSYTVLHTTPEITHSILLLYITSVTSALANFPVKVFINASKTTKYPQKFFSPHNY